MAHVETSKLSKHEVQELATVYAALLLSDAGVALDHHKLESIGQAAGVHIHGDYAKLFVRALKGKKVETFLSVGGGGAAEGHTGGAVKAEKAQAKKEEKPEPKKETKKEPVKEEPKEEDLDMGGGMGMFGDDF